MLRSGLGILGRGMFLSTFEKQLDAKRRFVVPQEFRALVAGTSDGIFCFPSIASDCLEGGGKPLFDRYLGLIEELPFGDPLRSALETSVPGVFAAGDVTTVPFKQIIIATGDGAKAALGAFDHLIRTPAPKEAVAA